MRHVTIHLVVAGLLAGALAAGAGGGVAAAPKPVIVSAKPNANGVVTVRWRLPAGTCSYSVEVLTPTGGRIYSEEVKCAARAHTTEAFRPGPNNTAKTLFVRVGAFKGGRPKADCLARPRQPLCRTVQYSAKVPVRIQPRGKPGQRPGGTGAARAAAHDGAYEVDFVVESSATALAKPGDRLTGIRFTVKNLEITGDISGKIAQATGTASGESSGIVPGLSCTWSIGFKVEGPKVAVTGNASCNNGLVAGKIEDARR